MTRISTATRGALAGVAAGSAVALLLFGGPASAGVAGPAMTAKKFKNCTALNRVYPHGVGRVGARDKTSGDPVTNFKRSNKLYRENSGSDRDKDGIACEKA